MGLRSWSWFSFILGPNSSLLGHSLLKYSEALKVYRQLAPTTGKTTETECDPKQCKILANLRTIMENQVLSYKKQNTIMVELLIKAHDCFVHECSMEVIHFVLARCKVLTSVLAAAQSWRLIVKLLIIVIWPNRIFNASISWSVHRVWICQVFVASHITCSKNSSDTSCTKRMQPWILQQILLVSHAQLNRTLPTKMNRQRAS